MPIKKIIKSILILLLSNNCTAQEIQPKNLDECNIHFDKTLSKKDIEHIKNLKEDDIITLHFGLGLFIRNNWIRGERNPELVKFFSDLKVFEPDFISGVILENYWSYLNNKKFDLNKEIENHFINLQKRVEIEHQNKLNIDKTEALISSSLVDIKFNTDIKVPTLKIPNKIFTNDINSLEFIKHKNGFIVNSLTTSPSNPDVDIAYNYFYFDLKNKEVFKLKIDGFDFVESIISIENTLYIAGKLKHKIKVIKVENNKISIVNNSITGKKGQFLNDSSWIKFGKYNNQLYALQNNGAYLFDGLNWVLKAQFNMLDYFKKNSISNRTIIPTENIKVNKNKLYFLQEIVQGRDCDLVELDMINNNLSEFWQQNNIIDNYKKEINNYTFLNEDSLLVSASRLGENILILKEKDKFNILINENKIKTNQENVDDIRIKTIIKTQNKGNILIAENGMFKLQNSTIEPLLYFENTTQLVKFNETNSYHYNFIPRCGELIEDNMYLLGGQFGGLLIVDLSKKEITCFDDKKAFNSIDLLKIK
jgi:hypothetical protein